MKYPYYLHIQQFFYELKSLWKKLEYKYMF